MSSTQSEARARLLQPEVLAGLGNLELAARAAVEGTLLGLHRSMQFGFSQGRSHAMFQGGALSGTEVFLVIEIQPISNGVKA